MSDSPSIHPLKPESQAAASPVPLFGDTEQRFAQELRLAAQAQRAGRLDEAIAGYLKLLAVQPHHAEVHNNLGVALRLAGKLEASLAHHQLALAADPENPALQSNLGNALRAAGRLEEAVRHHFKSITLSPTYAEGFFNLALCLRDLGRLDEAVGCFGRSLALHPASRRAKVELALALLMRGDLLTGFAAYEERKRLPETPQPEFSRPAWDGGPIGGKRILLHAEQGLSDVLLFIRFARELKAQGASVLVLCQAPLKDLLAGADYIDQAVAEGEPLPQFDVHASIVSLPHLCRPDFASPGGATPYLRPPAHARIKLGRLKGTRLSIGIYWSVTAGQAQDRQRSAPFARFLALAGDPELLLFSLQGGAAQKEIQQSGANGVVHDVGRGIFDFAEAASALSQLDLLISVDAPVTHVAAAMGVRTWLLAPPVVDWRWRLGGDQPWYPSLRIFRQPRPGDWDSVFASVRAELALLKETAAR
ncbi:MAG: glycosyltransferase family protein [Alphaproteobacteria bacterium]|nr:glycosyltransferase family protein [Alphaproteobacteria bacterium]MBV8408017.1 glycosyltransferase family protein [Alphaproteobacteria bacterium]